MADGCGLRPLLDVARPWLAGAVAVGVGQAVLLVAQAAVLASLLSSAFAGGLTGRAAVRDSLLVLLLAVGQGLAGWAFEHCAESAAQRARSVARQRALAHAVRLAAASPGTSGDQNGERPPGRADREGGTGGTAALLGPGIDELDPFVGRAVPRAVLALAVPALLLAWIARLNLLSAALAGLALALGTAVATLIGLDTAGAVRWRLDSIERLGDRFTALVAGLGLLRAFDRAADHQRSVAESGDEVRTATLATLRLALLTGLVLEIMTAVGTALVAVPLGLRLDSGARILPQALAILMITPEVFLPLRRAAADFHAGASGRTTLSRLSQLGAEAITVPTKSMQPGAEPPPHALGIVLEGVRLTAAGHRRPVLDGIDLRVRPGERLCVIGDSGAGKSSLLRVAAGLVTPTAGRAYLEGPGNTACRCPVFGWVPQHPTVLPATVLDNVALGRPGISAATARDALDAAQLGPWLTRLPLGMDTRLTDLDAPISLGERRRLAIARVLAGSQVGLWLLDEPTVGLDPATAGSMLTELRQVIGAATALIATHDPAALILGQRVIQLDRGRLLAGHPQVAAPEPGSHFHPGRPASGTA